ncbi:MAG: hypothetical protein KZQ85_11750 [Candidatus Thiodiazotropha sp. (ex Myrtea sp. 'scaly one' KF741663)]|nr:hypothetical protein [Candidatus Thiodiazotropha sp. (ex Myrtea sp. 'scaly one' KF741663)]
MDIIISLFLIIIGIALFLLSLAKLKVVRAIEDIPTSKIRSAHQGYVEIKGKTTLNGQGPLYVPRLKVPCVWYDYQIFREHNEDYDSEEKDKESIRGIYLKDATGICVLHAHLAQIHPKNVIQQVEAGATHRMSWIGVGEYVYVLGWLNTLHPAPRVFDVITKETAERDKLRYGQLTEPLATITKHPNGQYPFIIRADYEHKILTKLRRNSIYWLFASFVTGVLVPIIIVLSNLDK